ncbi:hypothetical protein [Larkinella sp. C7]|uniref:hypothetical protein n=1 Tax=Larkinella sp. C7 TaxID=2576607 RepID=UPI0011110260|nr:hypothetical protein [Larkinella sp. C7]
MKILMLLILLIPGLKVLDYAYVHSMELDSKPDSVTTAAAPAHTDVYLHPPAERNREKNGTVSKPADRGRWVTKGVVVSLVILLAVGLVRGRSR